VLLTGTDIDAWDNRIKQLKESSYRDQLFPSILSDKFSSAARRDVITVLAHQVDVIVLVKLIRNIDLHLNDSKAAHVIIFHEQYPSR